MGSVTYIGWQTNKTVKCSKNMMLVVKKSKWFLIM